MNKNHYCGLIIVMTIFLSILISGGASAAQVNNTTHITINDSKTVHNNSIIIKKLSVTENLNKFRLCRNPHFFYLKMGFCGFFL